MAGLSIDKKTGLWQIRFRWDGREYKRSLATDNEREALSARGRVEDTIRLLERGLLDLPPSADVATFIVSSGKRTGEKTAKEDLESLALKYLESHPEGSKAATSLYTERIHLTHLSDFFGGRPLASIGTSDVQDYVTHRSKTKFRGRTIGGATIGKEVATLQQLWLWCVANGHIVGKSPVVGIRYPKPSDKPPFRSWEECEQLGGKAWESVYLTVPQIEELLAYAKTQNEDAWRMFAVAAWTGMRRSEILRSECHDWDWRNDVVQVREKKRKHDRQLSFRTVPIHPHLKAIMRPYLKGRTGPVFGIARQTAVNWFDNTLKGSKWEVLKGYHVFRHSFASNLAARGVSQSIIDRWMGHQTEAMRRRYQHLFPSDQATAIRTLTEVGD